jgi:hypothetical protein
VRGRIAQERVHFIAICFNLRSALEPVTYLSEISRDEIHTNGRRLEPERRHPQTMSAGAWTPFYRLIKDFAAEYR